MVQKLESHTEDIKVVLIAKELISSNEPRDYRDNMELKYYDVMSNLNTSLWGKEDYKVYENISNPTKDGKSIVFRIAVESMATDPRLVNPDFRIYKYEKTFPPVFSDCGYAIYACIDEYLSKERTRFFYNKDGDESFDRSIYRMPEDSGPETYKFRFPSYLQNKVICVDIDEDFYISLMEYSFLELNKRLGISIIKTILHCAKGPWSTFNITKNHIYHWLPKTHHVYLDAVLNTIVYHRGMQVKK